MTDAVTAMRSQDWEGRRPDRIRQRYGVLRDFQYGGQPIWSHMTDAGSVDSSTLPDLVALEQHLTTELEELRG